MKNLKNITGFSLMEVIVTAGIISGLTYVTMSGMEFFKTSSKKIENTMHYELMVSSLLTAIRSNLSIQKIDFNPKDFLQKIASKKPEIAQEVLPLAWKDGTFMPVEKCLGCPGRMGYVITPSTVMGGMFDVYVALTHSQIFPNDVKVYNFLVGGI